MTAVMSTSLNVVSDADSCCAWTSRSAMRLRSGDIGTTSSRGSTCARRASTRRAAGAARCAPAAERDGQRAGLARGRALRRRELEQLHPCRATRRCRLAGDAAAPARRGRRRATCGAAALGCAAAAGAAARLRPLRGCAAAARASRRQPAGCRLAGRAGLDGADHVADLDRRAFGDALLGQRAGDRRRQLRP